MDRQRTPRLSLDLLRGFRSAARHLSFTHAARELFVTQSAISHQVKTLEDQLGRPLFRRVNRALELTQTGAELYRAIDEALTLIDDATQRASGPWRTLSVTTTVALASTWLVPRLQRFAELHPEIDLRVVASNDTVDLKREHIDVAIRFATLDMADSLSPAARRLRQSRAAAASPRLGATVLLIRRPVRPALDDSALVRRDEAESIKGAGGCDSHCGREKAPRRQSH